METIQRFSLAHIWNDSLITEDRPQTSRDYLWASGLFRPPVDLWLELRGVPFTNKPNSRARRKFFAGNLTENFVQTVMMLAGVITEQQEEIWTRFDIHVKGKGDFILAGKFNFEGIEEKIKHLSMPQAMEQVCLNIATRMKTIYGGVEFEPCVLEIKSVAERTMTKIEKNERPIDSHIYQTAHYKIGRNLNDALVVVICRDDLRMFEYHITDRDEANYINHINRLAVLVKSDQQPEVEKEIIFDESLGKFSKNLQIEYSNYLTLLYPQYDRPDQYSDSVKPKVARWNRLLARLKTIEKKEPFKTGKEIKLTPKNIDVILEMKRENFDAYSLAKVAEVVEDEE